MGAEIFRQATRHSGNIRNDFHAALSSAQWTHGHGGYTGSLAEKYDFVDFTAYVPEVYRTLEFDWCRFGSPEERPTNWPERDYDRVYKIADDKWGPAAAFVTADGKYVIFFGWASS